MTVQELETYKSEKGGWNKKNLAKLGVAWPPTKGWKYRLLHPQDSIPELNIQYHNRTCSKCKLNPVYLDLPKMDLCEPCLYNLAKEEN
jgi:hypothetical protein